MSGKVAVAGFAQSIWHVTKCMAETCRFEP